MTTTAQAVEIPAQALADAKEALKIVKITMMMQRATTFYTSIFFSLKQVFTTTIDGKVPLSHAATDGRELLINPLMFNSLSPNKRIGLMAHEILHVAMDHMHRRGERDAKVWNEAADYVINAHLLEAGYELPEGGLFDKKFLGKTTEQAYDILYKKKQKGGGGPSNKWGQDVLYPEDAAPGKEVTQEEVTEIVLRATTQSQMMGAPPGSVPAECELALQQVLCPPLPWDVILMNYLTEFVKDDYSWRKPNRRFLPDHYLPTAHSEAVCNLAWAVDASSSVGDHEFCAFITKMEEAQRIMQPKEMTVIDFTTRINKVQKVLEGENPLTKLKFNGRGGTNIKPVLDWAAENKPTVLIVFTDGYFTPVKPKDPSIPIIWLIHDNPTWKSDYGRVIHYDIPKK